jgi:hypothetical protein
VAVLLLLLLLLLLRGSPPLHDHSTQQYKHSIL